MLQGEKQAVQEVEKLSRSKSDRVTAMLKEMIRKRYLGMTSIDLKDLLQWNLWPCLLKVFGTFLC